MISDNLDVIWEISVKMIDVLTVSGGGEAVAGECVDDIVWAVSPADDNLMRHVGVDADTVIHPGNKLAGSAAVFVKQFA